MTSLTIYHFHPKPGTRFHFGEQGNELEGSRPVFSSDSLFSALVATVAEQEGIAAVETFLAPFLKKNKNDQLPWRITSLFPRLGEVLLFPRPRLPISAQNLGHKFSKKVNYVSQTIWKKLLAGEPLDHYVPTQHRADEKNGSRPAEGVVFHGIWLTNEENKLVINEFNKPWENDLVNHVTLDRLTNAGMPFLVGGVRFNEGCGLWGGVQFNTPAEKERFTLLLHHLGDRGIGGERSTGHGGFTITLADDLTLPSPAAATGRVLLSRYYPQERELNYLQAPEASYKIEQVGGWLNSPSYFNLRRRKVNLVAEASYLVGEDEPDGAVADVTPLKTVEGHQMPHSVYRYGIPLSVPVAVAPKEQR